MSQYVQTFREASEGLWWRFGLMLEKRETEPKARGEQLKRFRTELRRCLARTPWWIDGHLHLGRTELDLMALQHEKPTPRQISTVRISADAALVLLNSRSHFRKQNARRLLEAKYLLALAYFKLSRYEDAVETLESILAINNAALASLVLEDTTAAEQYLTRIPSGKLTPIGEQARDLLTRERRGEVLSASDVKP